MKIGILGTGMVGRTLGTKLVELGHDVKMGSRRADNETATSWVGEVGGTASHGTFADAATHGELVFSCVKGEFAEAAIEAAGAESLSGKVLVDVSNPLDFSSGFPPTLSISGADSLGERIQKALPDTRVVKSLNTMNCSVMVDPGRVPGEHTVFVSGNDADAKEQVEKLLREGFGWKHVLDLGDITTARGTEAFLMLWVRLYGALGTGNLNIHVARGE